PALDRPSNRADELPRPESVLPYNTAAAASDSFRAAGPAPHAAPGAIHARSSPPSAARQFHPADCQSWLASAPFADAPAGPAGRRLRGARRLLPPACEPSPVVGPGPETSPGIHLRHPAALTGATGIRPTPCRRAALAKGQKRPHLSGRQSDPG